MVVALGRSYSTLSMSHDHHRPVWQCVLSLLNARNFILINPLMFTIPIVLFKCKTQRSKFPRLSQISCRHSSTLLVSLFSSSARYASKILHDFISGNHVYFTLSESLVFSSTLAVISICFSLHEQKTSFCKANPTYWQNLGVAWGRG